MSFLELIPKTVYAAAVAALLAVALALGAGVAYLRVEVAHGETKYSKLEKKTADEATERERVAREDAVELKRMQAKHASMQQEKVHEFHAQEAADRAVDLQRSGELDRLRHLIHDYSGGGGEGQANTDACRSERDRAKRLGADLEEAVGLQGEAESFIRQRDREVKLLKGVITNDRGLMQ